MDNLWSASAAADRTALAEAVQGSRAIGAHESLVLHGGGNSSIKDSVRDVTGRLIDVIYVKGSGWDMATIEPQGFAPMRLSRLAELLTLDSIPDPILVNELRCALTDASAPDPSIESLLHASLPHRAVLHSHADAIIALTNQPDPAAAARELYGNSVVLVPYVMPGFDLSRAVAEIWPTQATEHTVGMVLLNHGLFTFGDTMEEAYTRHIDLITRAEELLSAEASHTEARGLGAPALEPLAIAALRRKVSDHAGRPMILSRDARVDVLSFVARHDLAAVATRGPATPDHIIRTKQLYLVGSDVDRYVENYTAYFTRNNASSEGELTMLDPTPRVILRPGEGLYTVGNTIKDAEIVRDIAIHTMGIIQDAERLGRYVALGEADLFAIEYWDLEQAKLRKSGAQPPLTGQIALVTGAASGIGRSISAHLMELGACVIGLDVSDTVTDTFSGSAWLGLVVDVRDRAATRRALALGVERFGGLDMLVVAAGVFAQSSPITDIDPQTWDRTLDINVGSVQGLFALAHPLLVQSPNYGRVVVIGSKNVDAPGPGAAAYSASKAALTQLARVAALEWARDGIRVNVIHPDAVFDTALWTPELLSARAAKYGLSIENYKRRNLLSTEVTSRDVARMVAAMCSETFQSTTGAQVPVDGGNDRVI